MPIGETLLTSEFALGSEYDRAKGSYSVINFRLFKEWGREIGWRREVRD